MRTLITATLLGAMALTGKVMAAPATSRDASTPSMHVQVVPGHRAILPDFDFKALQGEYQMSDGSILDVSGEDRTLYASLSGHPRTELVPIGSNVFAARGEDMVLRFERQSNSRNDVTVNMPKR
jgi:hypothetical protein